MTKINYMGFTLYKKDIIHYIYFAEKHPNHYRDPNRLDYHTDRVVESFICALSENNFEYDKEDKDMCGLIERLIREYGCDEKGVYSEQAIFALRNLYKYQGLCPADAILTTRQPKADWRESFASIKKAWASVGENIGLSLKNFWRKGKTYILGGIVIGASLFAVKPAMNFFNSLKKQQPVEIKTVSEKKSVVADTVSWQAVAKISAECKAENKKENSDTVKKIIENKAKYQKQVAKQDINKTNTAELSEESAVNLEKACSRAPSIVINDLQKKGILPADYRVKTLKKYREMHPKSHISEVPSRILLNDIHQIYAKDNAQKLSDYVNSNQKRFLNAMRVSQKKQFNQVQHIRNLKQFRDLRS